MANHRQSIIPLHQENPHEKWQQMSKISVFHQSKLHLQRFKLRRYPVIYSAMKALYQNCSCIMIGLKSRYYSDLFTIGLSRREYLYSERAKIDQLTFASSSLIKEREMLREVLHCTTLDRSVCVCLWRAYCDIFWFLPSGCYRRHDRDHCCRNSLFTSAPKQWKSPLKTASFALHLVCRIYRTW